MDTGEIDEIPMLSNIQRQASDDYVDSRFRRLTSRNRSVSISIPMNLVESYVSEQSPVAYTGRLRGERRAPMIQMSAENHFNSVQDPLGHNTPRAMEEKYPSFKGMDEHNWQRNNNSGKNEHLLRSGQLGMCNDPYCTVCPMYYCYKAAPKNSKDSSIFDSKSHRAFYGDAKGCARRLLSFLLPYITGVMNPHARIVQQWNKFFCHFLLGGDISRSNFFLRAVCATE